MKRTTEETLLVRTSTTTSPSVDRLIVRHCANAHPLMCDYFVRKHRFSDLCRLTQHPGAKSKAAHIRDLIGDFGYALRNLRRIRGAQEIVTMGPMACTIAFLLKLGLLPTLSAGLLVWSLYPQSPLAPPTAPCVPYPRFQKSPMMYSFPNVRESFTPGGSLCRMRECFIFPMAT